MRTERARSQRDTSASLRRVTFIWTWGDFFGPLIYLRLPELFPASLALKGFLDAQSSSDYGSMFAMSVVPLIPLFLVFLFGQRFLLRGAATSGLK